jgi:methionine synthase I (cobalamin-dependent)
MDIKVKEKVNQERIEAHAAIIAAAMLSGNEDLALAASKYEQEQIRVSRAAVAIARNIAMLSHGMEPK